MMRLLAGGLVAACAISLSTICLANQITADQLPQSPLSIGPERIIGENNLEPIEEAIGTELYDLALGVARVEFSGGYCTGFRLGEDLIMTNNHCYSSCSSMRFRFGYERSRGRDQQAVFRCTRLESRSSALDYALMRMEPVEESNSEDWPILTLSTYIPERGEELFIAGHPRARRKEMDRSENCAVDRPPTSSNTNVVHTCDTEGGNSGSSVFHRATGHIIAIHWGYSGYNRAHHMKYVTAHIEANAPEAYAELTIADEQPDPDPDPDPDQAL